MTDTLAKVRQGERNRVAANIRKFMQAKGWSQSDLARAMWPGQTCLDKRKYRQPVKKDCISAWINGKKMPASKSLNRLAHVLGVTVERLLGAPPTALDELIIECDLRFWNIERKLEQLT